MFKERIREYYDALTPGFRKLADFLMQNTLDAAFLTASGFPQRHSRQHGAATPTFPHDGDSHAREGSGDPAVRDAHLGHRRVYLP